MGIKYTLLSHGYVENDLAWNVALPNPGSQYEKNPRAVWCKFPSFSVLFEHPDMGYILFDTGSCPGDEKDRRPKESQDYFVLLMNKEDFLDERLASLNLSPKDISLLIVSHMHWDHSGGLTFFSNTKAGQNIMIGKSDYMLGLTESHRIPSGNGGPYMKENFEFEGLNFNLIEEDQPIAPGIDLITLEGHSPCVLGLVVKLDSGTVIFPSDAVSSTKNYGPPPRQPGIIYDTLGFERAIKRLYQLQNKYNAKLVFSHDPEQFATWKLAPYFYE